MNTTTPVAQRLPKPITMQAEMLLCPLCHGATGLHHGTVRVFDRMEREDGPGVRVTIAGSSKMQVEPVPAERMPGRRHSLEFDVSCEFCGDADVGTVRISQHKGMTLFEWVAIRGVEPARG